MNKERLTALCLIILAAALSRVLPHPHNVAPIAAIALFSGAHFERKWMAFALPLLAMLVSDAVIGFYPEIWVTYLAFSLVVCLGLVLARNKGVLQVACATLAGSVTFFLITNFAPFYTLYPHTMDGIAQSYAMALPFFRNTLLGDAFYVTILFGGFALMQRKFSRLQVAAA